MAGIVGSNPSNLAGSVPGSDTQDELAKFFASYKAPQAPQEAMPAEAQPQPDAQMQPQAEVDPLEQFFATGGSDQVTPDQIAPESEKVAEVRQRLTAPGLGAEAGAFAGAGADLARQMTEGWTRFRASFARSDKELKQVLTEKYGEDKVKKVTEEGGDSYFLVKREGDKKFTKFDPDSVEIVGDLLDVGRDIVEGAVAAPGDIVAASVGVGGASTGIGAIPGLAAGAAIRGASVAGSMAVGDLIAEKVLGIEQDPERDKVLERAVGAGLGATLGTAADYLGRWAVNKRAAKKTLDKMPTTSEQAKVAVEGFEQATNMVAEQGFVNPVTGTDIYATANQINPFDKEAWKSGMEVADQKVVQAFYENQADMATTAIEKHAQSVADLSGNGTGQAFANYVDNVDQVAGQTIGNFRDQLLNKGEGLDIPVTKFSKAMDDLKGQLGFGLRNNQMVPPTPESLIANGIVSTDAEAKALISRVGKFEELIYNYEGKLTPKKLEGVRKEMQDIVKRVFKDPNASYEHKGALLKLKNAIMDDELSAIENNLSAEAKDAFMAAKSRYSQIQSNTEKLGKLLERDNVTSKALAADLFSGKATALDKIDAVKGILADKPELWAKIKGEYLNGVMEASKEQGILSPGKYFQQLDKLPKEVRAELFPDEGLYQAMKTFSTRIEDTALTGKLSNTTLGQAKRLAYLSTANSKGMTLTTAIDFAASAIATLSKDENTAKWLSQKGVEQIVSAAKKDQQGAFRNALYNAINAVGTKKTQITREAIRSRALSGIGKREAVQQLTRPADEPGQPLEQPQ